ncbi:MAG: tetratricopeptide repeat protein, partial [Acidobacteria bacterium]|nr:tetratricopeptide repeat protein [Acidobacteriota bacterium]
HQMFRWRDPESSFWWLLAFSVIAIAVGIRRKHLGAAVLLAGASALSVQYLRFQGLFACMAVVLGGAVLDEIEFRGWQRASTSTVPNLNPLRSIVAIGCALLVLCTGIRCADLVTNRHYIEAGEVVLFGPGEATWFPERAAKFIEDNHLAGNMFNDYNLGGFLEWRLPQHKAYVDSRAIPFGIDRLVQQRTLLRTPLDSPQWAQAAAQNNVNFAVVSLDRYTGLGKVPLQDDCRSRSWRPVYLDETAAVFLRNTTENTALIQKFGIDCATMQLPPPDYTRGTTYRARGNAYNFFANAGSVFYVLARDRDAEQFLLQAAAIEPHDANLHLTLAQLYQAEGQLQEAEGEYKSSVAERPTDLAWYLLGILYGKQQRYAEAIAALEHSAGISYQAADRYRVIGQIQNTMGNPTAALESLDRAEHAGSHGSVDDRRIFASQLAAARARSWELLHDLNRAIEEQSRAADLMPDDPNRWAALASLYREQGNSQKAQQAQARADSLVRAPVSR